MLGQEQTDCEDRFHSVIIKLKTIIDKKQRYCSFDKNCQEIIERQEK